MKTTVGENQRLFVLTWWEIKQFFAVRANLRLLLLLPPAVFLALWPYIGSVFVPVFLALFIGLEPQYNNILFRTPHELESLSLFPMDYSTVVLAKNFACIVLTVGFALLLSVVIANFSPSRIAPPEIAKAGVYLLSVIFVLLVAGNHRSLRAPRRTAGVSLNDAAEAVVTLVVLAASSVPYILLVTQMGMPGWCLLYAAATGMYWYRYSIRKTAVNIQAEKVRLCEAA